MPTKLPHRSLANTNTDDLPMSSGKKYRPAIARSETEDPDRAIAIDSILLKLYAKQKALKRDIEH